MGGERERDGQMCSNGGGGNDGVENGMLFLHFCSIHCESSSPARGRNDLRQPRD